MNNSNLINKEENEIQIIMRAFHSLVISIFKNNEYLYNFSTKDTNLTTNVFNLFTKSNSKPLKYYLKLYG
jgi:hypothetical protein